MEANVGQLVQAGLLLAAHLQHLAGFFLVQLHEVGLELGIQEDRVGRGHQFTQFGLAFRAGQHSVVHIEHDLLLRDRKSVV